MSNAVGSAATLHRLWAVARLTLLEAVRRKVFLLLLLFGAAIVSSAAFFPAIDAESRLRLIEVWSVRASHLFSVIVAIFIAGFSLPSDFENRRIYTLVTKPLHRVTFFAGKFLGFLLLLAVFLACMAVLSVAYIRVVSLLSRDFPALKAEPRFWAQALEGEREFLSDRNHSGRLGARASEDGPMGAVVWRFRGLDRQAFAERMKIKVKGDLGRRGQPFAFEGRLRVRLRNPQTGDAAQREELAHTNQELTLEFDRALVADDGRLDVSIEPLESGMAVSADSAGVVLYGAGRSFEVNFFKGMLLVWFQAAVVMVVTLAASTYLTAPVSIVLGISLYVVGGMWGYLQESVRDIDVQMEAFRAKLAEGKPQDAYTPEDLPPWLLEVSTQTSKGVLKIIPDFSRFNLADYLLADHAVMGADLLGGFLEVLPRVVAVLLLGFLLIYRRNFAA
ncbi:MAG: hypothetical protein HYY16_14980 [Planctomycetes bacterium]|nr:hypothetical protein [Planctomycetota bacterium]